MTIAYKPYGARKVDYQYHDLLKKILKKGRVVHPIHGEEARMIAGYQMRFKMENGFPLITERDMSEKFFRYALAELCAFLNGAQTHEELLQYGYPFWKRWTTKEKCATFGLPEGHLGGGSYGNVWTRFPTRSGQIFNQITAVLQQIKERPFLRTHRITNWSPANVIGAGRDTVVAPCHGDVHFLVYPDQGELDLHHIQRSGDIPTGVPFNFIHYAALGMMFAHLTGYIFNELIYTFSDAHIYESQYNKVEELLGRRPRRFPTVTLDTSITNILDFLPEHFALQNDYRPHPSMTIPTPT